MNREFTLKSSILHPPPEYLLQQKSHNDILKTSDYSRNDLLSEEIEEFLENQKRDFKIY